MLVLYLIFSTLFIRFGYPLQCYRCSGSSRNADKADKPCVYGYSSVDKQDCPYDHVCTTYQYEISIHGLIKSSLTIRGCQPYEFIEDCAVLLKEMRTLLHPARIRELNCHSCNTDLCNSLSNI